MIPEPGMNPAGPHGLLHACWGSRYQRSSGSAGHSSSPPSHGLPAPGAGDPGAQGLTPSSHRLPVPRPLSAAATSRQSCLILPKASRLVERRPGAGGAGGQGARRPPQRSRLLIFPRPHRALLCTRRGGGQPPRETPGIAAAAGASPQRPEGRGPRGSRPPRPERRQSPSPPPKRSPPAAAILPLPPTAARGLPARGGAGSGDRSALVTWAGPAVRAPFLRGVTAAAAAIGRGARGFSARAAPPLT